MEEIVFKKIKNPRLTVALNRVSIKIPEGYTEDQRNTTIEVLKRASIEVINSNPSGTLRGTLEEGRNNIKMSNNCKKEHKYFTI